MVKLPQRIVWIYLSLQLSHCNIFIPKIPIECFDDNMCEDVPNYPHEYVDGIIKKLEKQGYMWQSDIHVNKSRSSDSSSDGDETSLDLCPSTIRSVTPLAAKDIEGKWRFVINRKTSGYQVINIRRCKDEVNHGACGKHLKNEKENVQVTAISGYVTQCQQEFLHRSLTCLDEYGKLTITAVASIACCSCAVFKDITKCDLE